jgi:hypothetical protein
MVAQSIKGIIKMQSKRNILVLAAVWSAAWNTSSAFAQLGVPISAPVALNVNAGSDAGDDSDAQVTTDGAGRWVAVWTSRENLGGTIGTDFDILVSRSTDNGATWSPPAPLNTNAASDASGDFEPQVATDGAGNWVALWSSRENLGGTIGADLDILVSRSTDNGLNWSPPAPLNTNAASDTGDDFLPQVTTDEVGNWVAVWDSTENLGGTIGTDDDILVSRSTDNGATWTPPAPLNTNAASDVGSSDEQPQVATDAAGNWVAVWESFETLGDTIGTDRDILVARSTDNGVTWSPPAPLNSNAASDAGGDFNPQVAADGAGNWVALWQSNETLGGTIGTDEDIFVSRSTDNGLTFSPPAPLNTNAASDVGVDLSPQVTTDRAGNWLALWTSNDNLGGTIGFDFDILVSRSTDNGLTWSPPAPLNTNAISDAGNDFAPQLTTDGAGHWVALWLSTDTLGGTVGTDQDIFVARFALPDCNTNGIPDGQDIASGASDDCNVDGVPDECTIDADGDDDTDGIINACDNCPDDANANQADADNDSVGDNCDNCLDQPNPDQTDADNDGLGNACDNCPNTFNPDQADADNDAIGDACEPPPPPPPAGPCGAGVGLTTLFTVIGCTALTRTRRQRR